MPSILRAALNCVPCELEQSGRAMPESLRGHCLIAAKRLRDPNFYKTVVLMVEHGSDGAMGLVINRPSSVTVAHALSEHFKLPETDDLVYVGGPVEPSALFILHNSSELDRKESPLIPGVFVGSSADVFEEIVRSSAGGNPDLQFRIYSGCAGWAPGQLEGEIARGDWYSHPAETYAIFGEDPYAVWDSMIAKVYESNRILPEPSGNPEWN
jgi:putative transcriptional regulator